VGDGLLAAGGYSGDMDRTARIIPIALSGATGACTGAEPFALVVLGDAMAPEFREGDVIVAEPEALATDGAYVVAFARGEWIFRQLRVRDGAWQLVPLDPRYPVIGLDSLEGIRGVVIQRSTPGRRSLNKRYGS
jgi:DNA polymerase V